MKKSAAFHPRAYLICLLLWTGSARATELGWDSGNTNNGTILNPANGTWNVSSGNLSWNNAGANVAWPSSLPAATNTSAVFGGPDGSYAITVGGALTASNMWFQNSGYALSAASPQTISLAGNNGPSIPQIRITAGATATIGANVTVQNGPAVQLIIGAGGSAAGGTLNINSGGTVKQNSSNTGGIDGNGTVVNVNAGGNFLGANNNGGSGAVTVGSGGGSDSTLNIAGGTFNNAGGLQPLNVGQGGTGTLNVNSGTVVMSASASGLGIVVGNGAGSTGTINLNGGSITTPLVRKGSGTATFNFNGGTLKANRNNAAFLSGLTTANIRNGGAEIDTSSFEVTITQPLLHSTLAGDDSMDGGLVKLGSGTLTLAGNNSYTGDTTISNGTVAISGTILGRLNVLAGSSLTGGSTIGPISISNVVSLAGTTILRLSKSSGATNDTVYTTAGMNFGGTLTVALIGGTLAPGDVFTLFAAKFYLGSFAQINLPPLPTGMRYDVTQLNVDGTLRVVADMSKPTFSPVTPSTSVLLRGGSVTLSGNVSGMVPMTYQWQLNGANIPGATSSTLALNNLTPADSGSYTLAASNSLGAATNPWPANLIVVDLLLDAQKAVAGLQLKWKSDRAYLYQLKASGDLISWTNYGPAVIGTGDEVAQAILAANKPAMFFSLHSFVSPIDPARMPVEPWKDTQWIDPGGWATIDVTTQGLTPNNTNINAATKVSQIVQSGSGRRRLYFPQGTYYFNSTLLLKTGDLWIDGDGRDKTIFQIIAPGASNSEISFSGDVGNPMPVIGSVVAGATTLTLTNASSFYVGDIVQLYATNAPLVNAGLAFNIPIYSQIFKVLGKAGDTLTLDMKVLLDYDAAYAPVIRKLSTINNVKVQHIKIDRINQPTAEDVSNLEFTYAYNCCVEEIESNYSGRTHVGFFTAKDCVIVGNYIHDCWIHNTGGYGYGYNLVATTGCRITNNKAARLRHEIIVSIGANHNVISYNSSEAPWDYNDVALHAVFAYMNLFEGNMFTEGYADSSKDGWPDVEAITGPGNTWFRNLATGQVGSAQNQTTRQNMLGNVIGTLDTAGTDHYAGANRVGGSTNWGVFNVSTTLPASLYLTSKPDFLTNTPWPVFGSGVGGWGTTNVLPARAGIPGSQ